MPPTITTANGRCVSLPILVDNAMGNKPSSASKEAINTGRKRSVAPSLTATISSEPLLRIFSVALSTTSNLIKQTCPSKSIKPIAALAGLHGRTDGGNLTGDRFRQGADLQGGLGALFYQRQIVVEHICHDPQRTGFTQFKQHGMI